jgi:mRNA interferase MazF
MAPEGVHRGGIYLVDFGPEPGRSENMGDKSRLRPALVVQNDLGNEAAGTTIVVALSSRVPSRVYPFQVLLPAELLGREGVIMCEQVRTVSLERVDPRPLAECPRELMAQVEAALRVSLGL